MEFDDWNSSTVSDHNIKICFSIIKMEIVVPAKTVPKETNAKVVTEEVMIRYQTRISIRGEADQEILELIPH